MTAEQAVIQALARASTVSNNVPATRSLWYRRLGVRQQQIFAIGAAIDPDYFGTCAIAPLVDGAADLTDIVEAELPAIEALTRVEINDPGTSSWTAGTRVHRVPVGHAHIADPPRITVRDQVLRGVGSDLDGVGSIKVYYPKRPDARMVRDTEIGLPEPHDELLVVDLARFMLSKTLDIEPESRIAAIQALSAEENDLLAAFEAHVRTFGPH